MHTFYLVRHGQKERQPGDPPLTEHGILQAQFTGQHFRHLPVTKIVASPTLRTQQTAEQIAAILELTFDTHPLLQERANWENNPQHPQTFDQFLEMWVHASMNRDYQPEVGDSSRNSGQRMEKIIHTLINQIDQGKDQHIVLVTHGGIIHDFLRNVF